MSVHKSVASVAGLLQLRSSYAWTVTSKLGGTVLGGVNSKVVLAQGAAATPPSHAMSKWQRRVASYGRSSCAQLAAAPKCRLHARELAIGGWLLLHAALLHRVSRAIGFSVYFGGAGATAWSKWPSWWGHSWPLRARQTVSEGVGRPPHS